MYEAQKAKTPFSSTSTTTTTTKQQKQQQQVLYFCNEYRIFEIKSKRGQNLIKKSNLVSHFIYQ
jgi:hypothetical protein